jgi:hypothetical protein
MAMAGSKATIPNRGFVVTQTASGKSLSSLGHYSMDWNNADMTEVSSGSSPVQPHPAGPSHLAQKVYAAKLAVQEVDKAAMV